MIFPFHIVFLILSIYGIVTADHAAFDWMRGKLQTMDKQKVMRSHWIVSIGLVGLVCTGLALFWPSRDFLMTNPAFWIKMCFVMALLVNSFVIESLSHLALVKPFSALTTKKKRALLLSGAVSTISWIGAAAAALFLFPN